MKTLVFCTSYAESEAAWNERWGRWLKAVTASGVRADKILIVDDGSPMLPNWPNVGVIAAGLDGERATRAEIHHFSDRRGQRVNDEPFPGWYRSFSYAVLHAMREGFDRIIHIEADAFLISDRAIDFFNTCQSGWVGLWCQRHKWPESTLQIINRDQFVACEAFFSIPYSEHLGPPYRAPEELIPFTLINKSLIGDRYGEISDVIPFGADYVSQVKWNQSSAYYWWMSEDGSRPQRNNSMTGFDSCIVKYRVDDPAVLSHTGVDYRQFLEFLDRQMIPRSYLEIGTHQGHSLGAMTCDAICIDPNFQVVESSIGSRTRSLFFQMTSDEFFANYDPRVILGDVDIGFLDGLHHIEALLKDFANFERSSHSGSLVLLHDCLPLNIRMVNRVHQSGPEDESPETRSFWTGDVWQILPMLLDLRPDLRVCLLDCPPSGLVLCSGLDSRSTKLMFGFESIIAKYSKLDLNDYGLARLWASYPMLSTSKIIQDPQTFCEQFGFRRYRT